jgi:hypothetical protein
MSPLVENQFLQRIFLPTCPPIWCLNMSQPTYLSCKNINAMKVSSTTGRVAVEEKLYATICPSVKGITHYQSITTNYVLVLRVHFSVINQLKCEST